MSFYIIDHLERSKEVAMLQEKISVTHMQLLNKEEEIKKLEKDNRCKRFNFYNTMLVYII